VNERRGNLRDPAMRHGLWIDALALADEEFDSVTVEAAAAIPDTPSFLVTELSVCIIGLASGSVDSQLSLALTAAAAAKVVQRTHGYSSPGKGGSPGSGPAAVTSLGSGSADIKVTVDRSCVCR